MSKDNILGQSVPLPTIRRMASYIRVLQKFKKQNIRWISTTEFAKRLSLKPIQVRKDLTFTGITGKPRFGFDVVELMGAIETILGWDNRSEAILIGAGGLGSALLGYKGFDRYGFHIVVACDINPDLVGKTIHDKQVVHLDRLEVLVKRLGVSIGILTVPASVGQEIADRLISIGIKGIWNFSPIKLKVPEGIIVQQEDLSSGLAVLYNKLSRVQENS